MTDQETKLLNAFATTLTAEMGPTDLTANVASISSLTTPCYLVINMGSDSLREYILFDGTFGASSFVATNINKRYLSGSAAGSNLIHPIGAPVQAVALQQHIEDLNDRIDADAAVVAALDHADLGSLGADDHSQYHNDTRGDARYLALGGGTLTGDLTLDADPDADLKAATKQYVDGTNWFPVVFSFGIGEVEVGAEGTAFRWKAERACTLVGATATAGGAPTGDSIDFDVSNDGTTMFSSKPTLAASAQDGTQATPSVTAIAAGDIIRAWVTQVGSSNPGENVALSLEIETP